MSPNKYRKQIIELNDSFKYNSLSSILESEIISEIYKQCDDIYMFLKKPVKIEYTKTFEVDVNSEPFIYDSVVDKIVYIAILEDNWTEYIFEIS